MTATQNGKSASSILISGAGIAGPALAYWLHRHGYAATVVERSAFLRDSGGAVDFRGEQVKLLKAMGAAQKRLVATTFADAGWETPKLLAHMADADDLSFDALSQIHVDRWSTGRVVLLSDAVWCAGPGGSGTGLAMMGARVLAGELAAADGDHAAAFAAYERLLRRAAKIGQRQGKGAGSFLAPLDAKKIAKRDKIYRMLTRKLAGGIFDWLTARAANAVKYKEYPTVATAPAPAPFAGAGEGPRIAA